MNFPPTAAASPVSCSPEPATKRLLSLPSFLSLNFPKGTKPLALLHLPAVLIVLFVLLPTSFSAAMDSKQNFLTSAFFIQEHDDLTKQGSAAPLTYRLHRCSLSAQNLEQHCSLTAEVEVLADLESHAFWLTQNTPYSLALQGPSHRENSAWAPAFLSLALASRPSWSARSVAWMTRIPIQIRFIGAATALSAFLTRKILTPSSSSLAALHDATPLLTASTPPSSDRVNRLEAVLAQQKNLRGPEEEKLFITELEDQQPSSPAGHPESSSLCSVEDLICDVLSAAKKRQEAYHLYMQHHPEGQQKKAFKHMIWSLFWNRDVERQFHALQRFKTLFQSYYLLAQKVADSADLYPHPAKELSEPSEEKLQHITQTQESLQQLIGRIITLKKSKNDALLWIKEVAKDKNQAFTYVPEVRLERGALHLVKQRSEFLHHVPVQRILDYHTNRLSSATQPSLLASLIWHSRIPQRLEAAHSQSHEHWHHATSQIISDLAEQAYLYQRATSAYLGFLHGDPEPWDHAVADADWLEKQRQAAADMPHLSLHTQITALRDALVGTNFHPHPDFWTEKSQQLNDHLSFLTHLFRGAT